MRSVFLVAAIAVLGVSATGCNLFGGGDETVVEQPAVEESPVASNPSPTPSQSFSEPTVEQKNAPKGILPPDLISSTDPNQRVQQVKGTRSDPFSLLPTTPKVQLADGAVPPTALPTVTALPPTGRTVATPPSRQTSPTPSRSTTASGTKSRPNGTTASGGAGGAKPAPKSPIANNPPRPQPTLARAVEVTGVVQVGDQVYAIVNAPNEPSSRYVQEGQRLAGGQVLVRRIETNRADPVVVLEQQGVEVVRAVGESGEAAASPAAATPAT